MSTSIFGRPRRWSLLATILCVLSASVATLMAAQAPPPQPSTQPAAEPPPTPPPDYSYTPAGRRDPFVPTLGRSVAPARNLNVRPEGVAGLLVSEVVVRGFLESRGSWVAMVGSPSGRSYTLRAGDRLLDGVVRAITSDAVIFLQEVDDPTGAAKHREVRKYLRGGEQVR